MATFPSQPSNSIGASVFMRSTAGKSAAEIDRLAADLVIKGNFPSFLRKLVPLKINKGSQSIIIRVSSDFMCIGTDTDYMIWAFSAPQCQRIVDVFKCIIPTVALTEEIYKQAKIKLPAKTPSMTGANINGKEYSPSSFVSSKYMVSPKGMQIHDDMIRNQLESYDNYRPGVLVAGHKKDVVIDDSVPSNRLGMHGLYNRQGKPIQGGALTPHDNNHIEYGMALRLVDRQCLFDGEQTDLLSVVRTGSASNLVGSAKTSYSYDKQKVAPKETENKLVPMSNYPKDPTTGAPKGYHAFNANEKPPAGVTSNAISIRDSYINMPFGTVIPFESDGNFYMARIEPHSNKPRGVTVYKKNDGDLITMPKKKPAEINIEPREAKPSGSLGTIYNYFNTAIKDIGGLIGD